MQKHIRPSLPLILLGLSVSLLPVAACGGGGDAAKLDGAASTTADSGVALSTEMTVGASAAAPPPVAEGRTMMRPQMGERASRAIVGNYAAPAGQAASASPAAPLLNDRPLTGGLQGGVDPAGAMLVRQGQATVEVKRMDDGVAKLRQAAAQHGGFVANATIRAGRDETRSATLELRVPSPQFDALVGTLSGLGKVEAVTATAQDVGDEYIDLTARAANARRVEARLSELLATRTGRLSDVLTVEQELARVRGEVERYDARLKFLERRTSLSTLVVSLHEPLTLLDRQPGPGPLAEAFARAWERSVAMLAWIISLLGLLIPLGLLAGAAWWVVRRAAARTPAASGVSEG